MFEFGYLSSMLVSGKAAQNDLSKFEAEVAVSQMKNLKFLIFSVSQFCSCLFACLLLAFFLSCDGVVDNIDE